MRTDQLDLPTRQHYIAEHYRNALPEHHRAAFDDALRSRLGDEASDLAVEIAARAAFTVVQKATP